MGQLKNREQRIKNNTHSEWAVLTCTESTLGPTGTQLKWMAQGTPCTVVHVVHRAKAHWQGDRGSDTDIQATPPTKPHRLFMSAHLILTTLGESDPFFSLLCI